MAELLRQVGREVRQILRHQSYRYEDLRRDLNLLANNQHLFTMVINVEPFDYDLRFAGHPVTPHNLSNGSADDLAIFIYDRGDGKGLIIDFDANPALYSAEDLAAHQQRFLKLVEAITRDPGLPVGRIDILDPAERRQILTDWNATSADYPQDRCIHELFEAQVRNTPDAVAVVFEDRQLTYAELNARANRLAHHLRSLGAGPETRVAICLERSLEMVISLLAVLKAGGAYVPLDPAYPEERLAFMLADSAPLALLTQGNLATSLLEAAPGLPVIDLAEAEQWAHRPAHNPDPAAVGLTPQHLAYIIYTSGSTGKPKGALIEHRQVARLFGATEAWYGFNGNDVWSLFHSYAFDFSVWEIWGALFHGGRLVIVPLDTARSPDDFYSLLCREGVTVLNQTPSAFRQLIAAQAGSRESHRLRYVIFGGEALEVPTLKPWYRQNEGTNTRLVNMYGITETTVHVTYRPLEPSDTERSGSSPIGCRIPDLRVYILDQQGEPAPIGVAGELYVGGAGVGRGYLDRPDLTAERFVPDPFGEPGARLYKTGDLGRWLADGTIEYLGRNDFQVKIRGFRIELGEIEAQLADCPGVREAVVLARESGAGDTRLVAYYTADEPLATNLLRHHLSERLAEYMVPAAYVWLEALPLTPNGKLDRKALPAPEADAYGVCAYEAPQDETEARLAVLWGELLGLDQVSATANFFELGGHSLLATRLAVLIRRDFGLELPIRTLFSQPTLRAMASALDDAEACSETPAIERVARDGALPLSYAQQRLWFLYQLEGASPSYNLPAALRLTGTLDRAALERAFSEIVRRHESLRTIFTAVDGEAQQIIQSAAGVPLKLTDLRDLPETARAAEAEALLSAEAAQPFDLGRGPLLRIRLLQLQDEEHLLLATVHHIAADGWSVGVLIQELAALYSAYARGEASPLAELPIQYADYAAWQRRWLQGAERTRLEDYWRRQLEGLPTLHGLPTDRPRPALQSDRGTAHHQSIGLEMTEGLKRLGQQEGATLFMTLQSALAVLLSRYSGATDIVLGTPIANRTQAEFMPLIGFFVNTLVLRLDLSGDLRFIDVLRQAKQNALDAYAHESLPFEQLVELMDPERSLSHHPLFQIMIALQNNEQTEPALPGLSLSVVEAPRTTVKFDLLLDLQEGPDGLKAVWEYAADLFDATTIERLAEHFRILLEGILSDSEQTIHRLQLLSATERRVLLDDWNSTAADYPKDRCLHELFEAQALQTPEAVAVVFEDRYLTYAELNAQANRLAHHLRSLGVEPEARVALCLERSFELVVALLAVLKAGGAYVPLDPAYPEERLSFMLVDSAPLVLLTQGDLATGLLEAIPGLPVINLAMAATWADQPTVNLDPAAIGLTPAHLAYIIYTSGSTGQPKGAMNEHRGVVNRLIWKQSAYGLASHDAVLQKTPFSFDVSVWEFFWPLFTGARLVMARPEGHKDPAYLMDVIRRENITTLHFVPSMMQVFLDHQEAATCTSLIRVMCSGEALPESLARRFHERLPKVDLHNLYGPTEAAVDVTAWTYTPDFSGTSIPLGRPISNTHIYILDAQGEPVPIGVSGEIFIGGVQVGRGYLDRPDLTAERFVPDPFATPGARLYKTGDLGRWLADGTIEYLGRNDFQVKIRGFRIELGEIEAQLAGCPGVREAVVLARESGAGDMRLVAYYTAAEPLAADFLRHHLSERLAEYMVPAAYVWLESLPLTPNGKLDRKALPAPEANDYGVRGYEAPLGEVENTLAQIWAELLKVERVGRQDHFFALGGHSLLAVTLIERMRQAGLKADVRALFATPTLAGLAAAVGSGSELVDVPANRIPPECTAITPEMLSLVALGAMEIERLVEATPGGAANIQDIYPLAPLQEGILFHHLMAAEGDAYLLSAQLAFDTAERLQGTLGALQAVIDRHDILRTAMAWEGLPEPVQVVWRRAPLTVEEVVLDPEAGDAAAQLRARFDPRHYRLDVRRAPLMRAQIAHDTTNDRWLLLLLTHHLALDHTAIELLLEETQAHILGQADRLPAPWPFRNFVVQARQGISREEHEAFFRDLLGDVSEPTAPFGVLDVQGDGAGIEEAICELDSDLARRLREQARVLGVSAASLCHLAWGQVLARTTGREDVVFGTVLFGRLQGGAGADRVLGMFINTLPVRLKIGDESVADGVRRTHARLAEVVRHEHAPLVLAQRCSAVPAPAPLFTALLNYRHSPGLDAAAAETEHRWDGIEILAGEERTNYPLVLSVDDLGTGFRLTVQAQPPIEPERLCGYMHTVLAHLVAALEQAPETAVRALEVISDGERQILTDWNATSADYPQDRCIHELFEAQVRNTPDAVAVVFEDRQLTYAELNARANRLAHHLRSLGAGPETRVAICLERSLEMVISLLAVLKAGGAYVPLDPAYPEERLAFMLADSAPLALLTQGNLATSLLEAAPGLPVIDLAEAEQWAHRPAHNPDPAAVGLTPQHLAYIIYTSGSTGKPKGALIEHRQVARLFGATEAWYGFNGNDVWSLFHSYAFDFSVWEIWGALFHGGRLVIVPLDTARSPDDFYSLLCREGVTVLNQTPSAFRQLIAAQAGSRESHRLRYVIFGGEALEVPTLKPWYRQNEGTNTRLVNMYGITETTVHVTYRPLEPSDTERSGSSPIGCRIPDLRVYILDQQGEPAPIGVAGELYVGGAGVGRGYLDRPDLTAERFVPDPFGEPGARLYKTGDLGRWLADGTIEYLGRNDFQVKIRGFRIELGEIEAQLADCPGVREAVVLARESGAGDTRLVAYYTADEPLATNLLRHHLSERLAEYMVPAAYVWLEALPLTPNGKLDRKALPADTGLANDRIAVAPRNRHELQMTRIWQSLFNLDGLSIDDNFFELGGHSLLAVRLMAKIETDLGKRLSLAALFKAPTIEQLARLIEDESADEMWEPLVPLRITGSGPALFCVPGAGGQCHYLYHLAAALGSEHPVYAFQAKGMDGRTVPHASIGEMAACYVDLVLETQPEGPYYLAGHSLGGSVAFEMAKRLEASGREVGFVALLDAGMPSGVDASDAALIAQALRVLGHAYGREIIIEEEVLSGLAEEEQLHLIKPHLVELGVLREDAGLFLVRGLLNIFKSQFRMAYQPDGGRVEQVMFIQARERFDAAEQQVLDNALSQWKLLSIRPLACATVPGDHISMLNQENARAVAEVLQAWMMLEEPVARSE